MKIKKNDLWLEFACECVSSRAGYSDPWAGVAQNGLLPAGAKEQIINLIAREPMTVAQIAVKLGLSQPSVHAHISEMLESELICEDTDATKQYPAERYYKPAFPVISADDAKIFDAEVSALAGEIARSFESSLKKIEKQFRRTELSSAGWKPKDIAQYLFAKVQRQAREKLEANGMLDEPTAHGNGASWLFWAEEGREKE